MKVLISCYACSPYKGSEPGMGWNFVKEISQVNECHVIVESKFQDDIERYYSEQGYTNDNLHFYYISRSRHKLLRKIWPPSYYWFYKSWQEKAYKKACELDEKHNFDVIHQLNMVGYREPGYLWKMNKPLVWGPIGGFNITPWKLLPSMGLKGCIFYFFRNVINLWQMYTGVRVRNAMKKANAIISATADVRDTIKRIYGRDSVIIPEVGYSGENTEYVPHKKAGALRLCWCGQFTPGKSLNLLIDALAKTKCDVTLDVIGDGECKQKWQKQAEKYPDLQITWHGWVARDAGMKIMNNCDAFCITSLSDLTSTVLLEALSYGLPVIALDHCGFSNVITDKCGIKIPISSKEQVVNDIALAIEKIAADETLRQRMSKGAHSRAMTYSWAEKRKQIEKIYESL